MKSRVTIILANLALIQVQLHWAHPVGIGVTNCPDDKIRDSQGKCVERPQIMVNKPWHNPFENVEDLKTTTTSKPTVKPAKELTKVPSTLRNKVHQFFADAIVKYILWLNKS